MLKVREGLDNQFPVRVPTLMITIRAELACFYVDQGRPRDAESLEEQNVELSSRIYGEFSKKTYVHTHNLAKTYKKQLRWSEHLNLTFA